MSIYKSLLFQFFLLFSLAGNAETLKLPQGKGSCPTFTFESEKGWALKSDRKRGDRWILWNPRTKRQIARFDYKLPNTDQKMLPQVEEKELKLGHFKVSKYTVTLSLDTEPSKAKNGLITSYHIEEGALKGLILMSERYDAKSGLDKKIEKIIASIQIEPKT